ncbi:MAG: hypothetical protein AAFV86_01985 [Pseudomonadota bacterium]
MSGGIFWVTAMFVVPALYALNGMFGKSVTDVLSGVTEDRVKYVRKD